VTISAVERKPIYVGRFAPSPTGPLHFGSLVAAVSSYLDAKFNNGLWLVRVEDLDPPREPAGASDLILNQLLTFGLEWDREVLFQSKRIDAYQSALDELSERSLTYRCDCTRGTIKAKGAIYDGYCRNRKKAPRHNFAIRVRTSNTPIRFRDEIRGAFEQNLEKDVGDFVILRKDNLFAYHLAVVVDDDFQQITHIIRGSDLINSTPRQIYLQKELGLRTPNYAHIPIAVNDQDVKLSKQNFSQGIEIKNASALIFKSLNFLGQDPPSIMINASVREQLQWAICNWDIHAVPKLANIRERSLAGE
tara:strand:- start:437 stop:1351 length:915 start_codon:yes stop_codon:yes gene_type:complete